jgi:TonB family protein
MRPPALCAPLAFVCLCLAPAAPWAQAQPPEYHHVLQVKDLAAGALTRLVNPEFPLKAARQGIEKGYIEARLHVDDEGEVTSIDVTRSYPTGAFDSAATGALRQWRFRKGAVGNTVDVSIDFYRARP